MEFNRKKFQAIRFCDIINPPEYIDSEGRLIQHETTVTDLGIDISHDLSFDHQIRLVTIKGSQMAWWILRVFNGRERTPMVTLLKQMIHLRIEFAVFFGHREIVN